MADHASFEELQAWMFDLYAAKDFAGALEIAESAARSYPDRTTKTAYWRACLLSLMGRPEEAVSSLAQGLAHGAWWAESTLLQEPDLEAARALPRMAKVLAESGRRWQEAQANARLEVFTLDPPDQLIAAHGRDGATEQGVPPLMLAFHWRGGSGPEFIERFRPAAEDLGFLLASAQSSQLYARGEYCWDDQVKGEAEAVQAFVELRASRRFDTGRVVLAGASQGGRLAIALSLAGGARESYVPGRVSLPSRGFIAIVPAVRSAEMFAPCIRSAAERGVRGYIITGERDQFLAETSELQYALDNNGVPCRMEVVESMAHTFPKDFPERLTRAVRFVMGQDRPEAEEMGPSSMPE
ncbi:MAG: hypothetical protein NUW23_08410 [Firmicutes bacterium]|jgi:predicted esterase|nr:hypothetical protein [Bacillota bacterium]